MKSRDSFVGTKDENVDMKPLSKDEYVEKTANLEIYDKELENFFIKYDQLKKDRYLRRGISEKLINLEEDISTEKIDDKTIVKLVRNHEIEDTIDGVVHQNHSFESITYTFTFNRYNQLIGYESDDIEEMYLMNEDLDMIREKEINFEKNFSKT